MATIHGVAQTLDRPTSNRRLLMNGTFKDETSGAGVFSGMFTVARPVLLDKDATGRCCAQASPFAARGVNIQEVVVLAMVSVIWLAGHSGAAYSRT
jgi:hypothetical protein